MCVGIVLVCVGMVCVCVCVCVCKDVFERASRPRFLTLMPLSGAV